MKALVEAEVIGKRSLPGLKMFEVINFAEGDCVMFGWSFCSFSIRRIPRRGSSKGR